MQEKISVIIPVYNGEKFLPKLFENIDKQDYKDFLVYFINDGSTDGSEKLLTEYCEKRGYILKTIVNLGVSNARNVGLSLAQGEYIVFWDCDDDFSPTFLSKMVEEAKKDYFVFCGFTDIRDGKTKRCVFSEEEKISYISKNEIPILQYKWLFNTLWNKIFLNSVIKENEIKFNVNVPIGEDALFVSNYIGKIHQKVAIINEELYYYNVYQGNSSSKFHINLYYSIEQMYHGLLSSLESDYDRFDECRLGVYKEYFSSAMGAVYHYCKFIKENGARKELKKALIGINKEKLLENSKVKINGLLRLIIKTKNVLLIQFYYKKFVLRREK